MFDGVGPWNIPKLMPEQWVPCEFVAFNKAPQIRDHAGKGVHFFLDDYKFERIWLNWKRYGDMLSKFDAVMTPDFSMFTDWPKAVQLFNHYRKHFIGLYLQQLGVRVYPTIGWSDEESYDWCFDGEPENACVCISSVGCLKKKDVKSLFLKGYDAMLERLHPKTIIFYGDVPKECRGNIVRIKTLYGNLREATMDDED